MSKHTLTNEEREQWTTRRATLRDAAAARVDLLRQWHLSRSRLAEKRAAQAKKKAAKQLARQLKDGARPRGVDRVPAHLTGGNPLQRPPALDTQRVVPDRWPHKQYGDGQPGRRPTFRRTRPPRRRFMPVAEARRIERARKEWSA